MGILFKLNEVAQLMFLFNGFVRCFDLKTLHASCFDFKRSIAAVWFNDAAEVFFPLAEAYLLFRLNYVAQFLFRLNAVVIRINDSIVAFST